MVLTVYGATGSPPTASVYMVLDKLNLDYEHVLINVIAKEQFSQHFLKMNPQHTIPTLKDDDFVIWESHAITIYLVTVYGKGDTLYPADAKKRAVINQRLHFDSGILFPAMRDALYPVVYDGLKSFNPDGLEKVKEAYELAEKFLTNPWMAGDDLTLADICCVSSISLMDVILPIDKELYPSLKKWLGRMSELDFYIKGNLPGITNFGNYIKSFQAQ